MNFFYLHNSDRHQFYPHFTDRKTEVDGTFNKSVAESGSESGLLAMFCTAFLDFSPVHSSPHHCPSSFFHFSGRKSEQYFKPDE
jgi:hypothetical protein